MCDWRETGTAAERIEAVIIISSDPKTVNDIASEADVAQETVLSELSRLLGEGKVRRQRVGGNIHYVPSHDWLLREEVLEFIREHSRDELQSLLSDCQSQLKLLQEEYEASSSAELRKRLDGEAHTEAKSRILCSIENAVRERDHSVLASFLILLRANERMISRNCRYQNCERRAESCVRLTVE